MANGNTTISNLGQINAAGAADALFLKVFAGEILTTFEETNVMKALHRMRTISHGKSAQFPAIGTATSKYHVVGENILDAGNTYLSDIKHNERVITIDDALLAAVVISDIEEAKNHYDVRSEYATQLGRSLANTFDKQTQQVAILAARAAATITGGNGGSVVVSTNSKTVAADLVAAIFDAAQKMDEKDVPSEDRVCILKPAQYYLLVEGAKDLLDRDYGNDGNGSMASGNIFRVGGIRLVKSNHLPSTNVTTGPTAYQGDFTNTTSVCFQRGAVGTVKLLDLATESEYKIEVQGTLFVAKYAMGHGILRPECAVEIATI